MLIGKDDIQKPRHPPPFFQLAGGEAAEEGGWRAQVQPGQPRHPRRTDHGHSEPVRGRAREPPQDGR
jgi:hypothetical protein